MDILAHHFMVYRYDDIAYIIGNITYLMIETQIHEIIQSSPIVMNILAQQIIIRELIIRYFIICGIVTLYNPILYYTYITYTILHLTVQYN